MSPSRLASTGHPCRRRRRGLAGAGRPSAWESCRPPPKARAWFRRRRSTSPRGRRRPRPPCWRAAASGACRACSSMSRASPAPCPAMPAAPRRRRQYDKVGSGRTGHAESVRITYDPRKVSYGRLLQIYFSVAHDPTELNRQGPDVGTQYRSTIFPTSEAQAKVAEGLYRPARPGARLRRQDRHHDRARPRVLSGRGLSSGLT